MSTTIDNLISGLKTVTMDWKRWQVAIRQFESARPTMPDHEAARLALKEAVHGLKDEEEKYKQAAEAAGIAPDRQGESPVAEQPPITTHTNSTIVENVHPGDESLYWTERSWVKPAFAFIGLAVAIILSIWLVFIVIAQLHDDKAAFAAPTALLFFILLLAAGFCGGCLLADVLHERHIEQSESIEVETDEETEDEHPLFGTETIQSHTTKDLRRSQSDTK